MRLNPAHLTVSTTFAVLLLAGIPLFAASHAAGEESIVGMQAAVQPDGTDINFLWAMEIELGVDLDGDGYIGPPPVGGDKPEAVSTA